MVSVAEAESIILSNTIQPKVIEVNISESVGRVLAEPINADRDFPPFNRVTMDGIAIQFDAFKRGHKIFPIEGIQPAGTPQKKLGNTNYALEVMTGAMLPEGTDTVIRYEDIELKNGEAKIIIDSVERGQNIHYQGQDAKQGDQLLEPGIRISPAEVVLMAAVGKSKIKVFHIPKIAVISTGDELVSIDDTPKPWQIRRSNSYAIQASLHQLNIQSEVFHVHDDEGDLNKHLKQILEQHNIVILSGGVSKGKFDFVPKTLEAQGIKKIFHQVNQRPGKPFWFGKGEKQIVFALPGNPVSTYLCFYRYIKPWLCKSMGLAAENQYAILATDFSFKPALTYFLQVKVKNEHGKVLAYPDAGGGSGDFVNLKEVTGFLELPAERTDFKAGESFPYFSFRHE